jgi:hypothetical protein
MIINDVSIHIAIPHFGFCPILLNLGFSSSLGTSNLQLLSFKSQIYLMITYPLKLDHGS